MNINILNKMISATVIVKNEEANIKDCLESLSFVDEIIVVDSGSTDRTEEICSAFKKVRFFKRSWEGYGSQKNFAASITTHDWVLNLDADERISPQLLDSILNADLTEYSAFRMSRRNFFGNRWIRRCGWYPDSKIRLYDRRKASFSNKIVHEGVECDTPVGKLSGDIIHYTYSGVDDYLERMNRYSSLAANEIVNSGKRPGLFSVIFHSLWTFIRMYVVKGGVIEGYTGLLLSILYSQYTFLKYIKAKEFIDKAKQGKI